MAEPTEDKAYASAFEVRVTVDTGWYLRNPDPRKQAEAVRKVAEVVKAGIQRHVDEVQMVEVVPVAWTCPKCNYVHTIRSDALPVCEWCTGSEPEEAGDE